MFHLLLLVGSASSGLVRRLMTHQLSNREAKVGQGINKLIPKEQGQVSLLTDAFHPDNRLEPDTRCRRPCPGIQLCLRINHQYKSKT